MNLQMLQAVAATNQWAAIAPELLLALTALALLVLEILLPKNSHGLIPRFAIVAQFAIMAWLVVNYNTPYLNQETFGGMLRHSAGGQFMRFFFLLTSILVCFLGLVSLRKQSVPQVEFYHIILVITAAMMLLAQSNHFVMLFVALETITVGFYILVSYFRRSPLSLEAGLKYLIMGALSSAILLFGIVLLYGAAGTPGLEGTTKEAMHFPALRAFLTANPDNFLAQVGVVFVLAGVAFKIGAVPFQIWIPDVYQGAPTPVTAFLAVGSKAAGFAILLVLTQYVFAPMQNLVVPLLSLLAIATILLGNLAALTQHNVKRLIGLSGVSHAGYLLIGVIAAYFTPWAVGAVYFYLLTYLLASFAVFGVMAHLAGENDADQDLEHYTDLAKQHPFLGAVLAVGVGSLAGIPPLAGFMGKLLIFIAAFEAHLYALLFVAVFGVVISIYYYFGWIKAAFFATWRLPGAQATASPKPSAVSPLGAVTLVALAFFTILFGFFQGPLGDWLILR